MRSTEEEKSTATIKAASNIYIPSICKSATSTFLR